MNTNINLKDIHTIDELREYTANTVYNFSDDTLRYNWSLSSSVSLNSLKKDIDFLLNELYNECISLDENTCISSIIKFKNENQIFLCHAKYAAKLMRKYCRYDNIIRKYAHMHPDYKFEDKFEDPVYNPNSNNVLLITLVNSNPGLFNDEFLDSACVRAYEVNPINELKCIVNQPYGFNPLTRFITADKNGNYYNKITIEEMLKQIDTFINIHNIQPC